MTEEMLDIIGTLKCSFQDEILNVLDFQQDSIIVKLKDGTKVKISVKNVI